MEQLNPFQNDNIAETLKGNWGKEYYSDCKLVYIQNIIIAQGDLNIIKKKAAKPVYEWIELADKLYIGFIKG